MVLKSRVLDAPVIYSGITDGIAQIRVKFTQAETRRLVREIAGR
jgi:hypothetical protein